MTIRILNCDVLCGLAQLPDESVHLVVTSPPYNVGMPYEPKEWPEYENLIREVPVAVKRILKPGGRFCLNIANLFRKPYIDLRGKWAAAMEAAGLFHRGEIIWNRGSAVRASNCAWGSWCSPAAPSLRDQHEYVLVFSNGSISLENDTGLQSDLTPEEFPRFTISHWTIPPASATQIGHPAPFPIDLPWRLVKLYTWPGQTVCDIFMGSGTTGIVAKLLGRDFIGIELSAEYCELARKRIERETGGLF